jgi:hypothetical protein
MTVVGECDLCALCSRSRLVAAVIELRMDTLEDKPWDIREFAVVDLNGNLLRIGEVINE